MQSPQTFSRGNVSRSRTTVRNPACAQKNAHEARRGPPPTIATSPRPISRSWKRNVLHDKPLGCDYDEVSAVPTTSEPQASGAARISNNRTSQHELVHSDRKDCRHSTAHPPDLFASDRLARLWLLQHRRIGGSSGWSSSHTAFIPVRRFTRVRSRIRGEAFRDQHAGHHVVTDRWCGAT